MSPYLKAHIQWNKWQDKLWCPLEDAYYYLFIWYINVIFTQVKGQRLVYQFRNLPYKYEPGITRSVYRDRFQTINTSLCDQEPTIIKDLLPLIELNSSPPGSKAFFSSGLPPRGSSPWTASFRASSEGCTCLDVELSLSSIFCSKTRIYFPMREGHSKTTEWWQAGTKLESVST